MIAGTVNTRRQPMVELTLRGPQGQEERITAMVDTGFKGTLLIPDSVARSLGLPLHSFRTIMLADGSSQDVANYRARLEWEGRQRDIRVTAVGQLPLLGMALLIGYRISVDMLDGGPVRLERI